MNKYSKPTWSILIFLFETYFFRTVRKYWANVPVGNHYLGQKSLRTVPIHCNENSVYGFLVWELRGLSTNFHTHVSVSNLYIPRIGPHFSCSRIGRSIVGIHICSQTHECGNWECGRANTFLGIFVTNFRHWFFAIYAMHLMPNFQSIQNRTFQTVSGLGPIFCFTVQYLHLHNSENYCCNTRYS